MNKISKLFNKKENKNLMEEKNGHGGKRVGSGRKAKETTQLTLKVRDKIINT